MPSSSFNSSILSYSHILREMKEAAKLLEFEHAAFLRDRIEKLRRGENPSDDTPEAKPKKRKGKF